MPITVADLVTKLSADTGQHDTRVRSAGRSVDDYERSARRATGTGNSLFSGLGKAVLPVAALAGGVGLLGAGLGSVVGEGAKFNKNMSAVKSTMNATDKEMVLVRKHALELGMAMDVGSVSALDAGDAILELGKSGLSVKDILGGVGKSVLQLNAATGGQFGVANSAALAANALNTFNLGAEHSTRVVNTLVGAANASSIGLSEIKQGFSDVGSVAAQLGLSIEDTSAALAIFGNNGMSAGTAGGGLKTMLLNLIPATDKQMEKFKELGIVTKDGTNAFFDATGKAKDLAGIAGVLEKAFAGMSQEQRMAAMEVIFGSEAVTAAGILYKEGAKGVNEMNEQIIKQGDAAKVAGEMSNNLTSKWEAFMGTISTGKIMLEEFLDPFLSGITDAANTTAGGILDWLGSTETQNNIKGIGEALKTGIASGWDAIKNSATWVWDNVLKPAYEFFSRPAVKGAILDGIAAGWDTLTKVGTSIWEKGLKPFGEWLAKPETSQKLGEIAGFIGTNLANGAKLVADNIGLVVTAFATWKIASWTIGILDMSRALLEKLVPALRETATASAGGPGTKGGFNPIALLGTVGAVAGIASLTPGSWEEEMSEVRSFWDELDRRKISELKVKLITEGFEAFNLSLHEATKAREIELNFKFGSAQSAVLAGGDAFANSSLFAGIPTPAEVKELAKPIGEALPAGLAEGIAKTTSSVTAAAKSSATAVINSSMAAFQMRSPSAIYMAIGANLMTGLVQGMVRGGAAAAGAARTIAASVVNATRAAASPGIFNAIGVAAGAGFARGIAAGMSQAVSIARNAANTIIATTKAALAVRSPSKIFEEIGRFLMQGLTLGMAKGTPEAVKTAADASQSIVDLVSSAFDVLTKIGGNEIPMPGKAAVDSLFQGLDLLVENISVRLARWKGTFTEKSTELAGYIGSSVSSFGQAIEPLRKLGDPELLLPTKEGIHRYFDALDIMIPEVSTRSANWDKVFTEERQKTAGYIGSGISGMLAAVEPMAKLGDPDLLFPAQDGITRYFDALDLVIPEVSSRAAAWAGIFDKVRAETAGYIGTGVNGMLGALGSISKLGEPGQLLPLLEHVTRYFDALDLIIPEVSARGQRWAGIMDKARAETAGFIGTAANGLLGALSNIAKLGEPDQMLPVQSNVDRYFDALDLVIPQVSARAANWQNIFEPARAATAQALGAGVSGLLAAIEPLARLAKPDQLMPAQQGVDKFFDALDLVIPQISTRAAAWGGIFDGARADTAKFIGSAVADIAKAIEPLTKIAQMKDLPTTEQIDAFFWKLEDWLNQFHKRAELWARIATEKTAQMGTWIGQIADGIGKALDPLLKMAEAQKITPEQIEGAMANVWTAMHHFNRVMTGGSEGTPFEGQWMERAKAFAASMGEIFTATKEALTTLGSMGETKGTEGAVTIFAAIKDNFGSVFGPENREGTLLNMIFGADNSFFNVLDHKVPIAVGFTKGVWMAALDALGDALIAKLNEIRGQAYSAAYLIGTAITKGIADGLNGTQSQPNAAPGIGGGFGRESITTTAPPAPITPKSTGITINGGIIVNANNSDEGRAAGDAFVQTIRQKLGFEVLITTPRGAYGG